MKFVDATHYGRSWKGHHIEDACPCSQELCGLVSDETRHSDCEQHTIAKTIRQTHLASDCPGEPPTLENIVPTPEPSARADAALRDAKPYNDGYIAGLIEGLSRAEDIVEAARLVAQWHGAIGSGPVEVLDEELGALAALVAEWS